MNILTFIISVICSVIILRAYHWTICRFIEHHGTFAMDFSDPEKDICRLELDKDINEIYKRKYIILKIETKDYNSQK